MRTFSAPIVGMHFRPPAASVMELLAGGTKLLARRQPDNPYDEFAVMVLLPGFSEDGAHKEIFKQLIDQQPDPDVKLTYVDPLHIGYVDAKKTGLAKKISLAMWDSGEEEVEGILTFDVAGKPTITLNADDPYAEVIGDDNDTD